MISTDEEFRDCIISQAVEEYRNRDARLKCVQCKGWMRYTPTKKTPLKRSAPPHADLCTSCALEEDFESVNGDRIVTGIIAKANVIRSDFIMFTPDACRSMAEQLEKRYPGCVRYDEETQAVIYKGPVIVKGQDEMRKAERERRQAHMYEMIQGGARMHIGLDPKDKKLTITPTPAQRGKDPGTCLKCADPLSLQVGSTGLCTKCLKGMDDAEIVQYAREALEERREQCPKSL